ncbi:hypothetical protein POM88_052707 [Heracleum sosnowskyi]|uniref:S-adenosylmethionine synthetase C-terminal domain-containing protein n=1 Tax=Heracleum sosnowskyi TaxID=360622 RepID=A0AAD8GQZ5_9APIA|nr:hypothetical protein POM88_052707 [Heracleum sosnowskyi]
MELPVAGVLVLNFLKLKDHSCEERKHTYFCFEGLNLLLPKMASKVKRQVLPSASCFTALTTSSERMSWVVTFLTFRLKTENHDVGYLLSFARRCIVQVSYATGVPEPLSVFVDSYGTGKIPDSEILKIVKETFDFREGMISINLDLKRGGNATFLKTASYGHFVKPLKWEKA